MTYPWHPLCGQSLELCVRKRDGRGEHFCCRLPDDTLGVLPAWMFAAANREYAIGPPVIAIDALAALSDLLAAVRAAGERGSSLRSAREDRDEATATPEPAVTSAAAERPHDSDSTREHTDLILALVELLLGAARAMTPDRRHGESDERKAPWSGQT